jgi:hypothetical protein
MTLPNIHLGGTPRSMLHGDYQRAEHALWEAMKAFESIEFNGRDYLGSSWDAAVEERTKTLKALQSAYLYLNAHAEHTAPTIV